MMTNNVSSPSKILIFDCNTFGNQLRTSERDTVRVAKNRNLQWDVTSSSE